MPGLPVIDSAVLSTLQAIGSSTIPIPVVSNAKTGTYAYSAIGSPSVSTLTANQVIYSTPFIPLGEAVTLEGKYFKSGLIALGSDATAWLECDPSGGVNYVAVVNSLFTFGINVPPKATTYPSFVYNYAGCRGGNWRLAICMGAVTGTATGATGFNVFAVV